MYDAIDAAAIYKELAEIKKLDADLEEAIYKWIDREIGIPGNAPMGGFLEGVDAFPVFLDLEAGVCYATAVDCIGLLLPHLNRPLLCGMVKYDTHTEKFLEAIPLCSWPQEWSQYLKRLMEIAYYRAEADFRFLGMGAESEEPNS